MAGLKGGLLGEEVSSLCSPLLLLIKPEYVVRERDRNDILGAANFEAELSQTHSQCANIGAI